MNKYLNNFYISDTQLNTFSVLYLIGTVVFLILQMKKWELSNASVVNNKAKNWIQILDYHAELKKNQAFKKYSFIKLFLIWEVSLINDILHSWVRKTYISDDGYTYIILVTSCIIKSVGI